MRPLLPSYAVLWHIRHTFGVPGLEMQLQPGAAHASTCFRDQNASSEQQQKVELKLTC